MRLLREGPAGGKTEANLTPTGMDRITEFSRFASVLTFASGPTLTKPLIRASIPLLLRLRTKPFWPGMSVPGLQRHKVLINADGNTCRFVSQAGVGFTAATVVKRRNGAILHSEIDRLTPLRSGET